MESLWKQDAAPLHFRSLEKDCKTDVLVIGGGIAGILCAYMLRKRRIDCLLVEADRICSGVTGNTTAKVTAQHGLCYAKIAKRFGISAARKYYEANCKAIDFYRSVCKSFPCDFRERDSFVYSKRGEGMLAEELSVLREIGADASAVKETELPMPISGALMLPGQYQIHPLKFLFGLSVSLPILEKTRVEKIHGTTALTDRGSIHARHIIIATHFPMINTHGFYFLKLYQSRSYVLAINGVPKTEGMYIDEAEDGLSFRNAGDFLLLGGGSHRTGTHGSGWRELERFAEQYYPNAEICARWATQDCMTLDGFPYIGNYSYGIKNIYVATGFEKWGMTRAVIAAEMICDMIEGKGNCLSPLFSPSRSWLHPQLLKNAGETVLNFLKPVPRRCPHMGCALKWNPRERTWDCPCHGSRFSSSGGLLNEPAKRNLKK